MLTSFPKKHLTPIQKNISRHTLYTQCQHDEVKGFKIEGLLILDTEGKTDKMNMHFSNKESNM